MSETALAKMESRPLRLAFFVDPRDRQGLLDAIEISTCLWGGVCNPILPILPRPLMMFRRPCKPRPSPDEVLQNFIEVFAPDAVVAPDPGRLAKESWNPPVEVLPLGELLMRSRAGAPEAGLAMTYVYQSLHERRYQFVAREPEVIVRPEVCDSDRELLTGALWGRLPTPKQSGFVTATFERALRPRPLAWEPRDAHGEAGPIVTPLDLTLTDLHRGIGVAAYVILIDHREPLDVMAFWSLRAYGRLVLGIPLAFADTMIPAVKDFTASYTKAADSPGPGVSLLRGPSVRRRAAESFDEALAAQGVTLRHDPWFPPLWLPEFMTGPFDRPGWIAGQSEIVRVPIDRDRIRLDVLAPPSAARAAGDHAAAWVNLIQIRGRRGDGESEGFVLPAGTRAVADLMHPWGSHRPRLVGDALATVCRGTERSISWRLPKGPEVVRWWFGRRGWNAVPSGAGLIAENLIKSLGGIPGVAMIAHEEVIRTLDRLSGELGRRAVSREELLSAFDEALKTSSNRNPVSAETLFDMLVDRGLLRLGMEVQCSVCRQRNWYAVGGITPTLECAKCLSAFGFPVHDPPERSWRYRPVGPVAIERFAQGGYAVALAIRFFLDTFYGEASWTTGLDLRRPRPEARLEHREVDAALFWTGGFGGIGQGQGQVILIEAKSFGSAIEQADVDRAEELLKEFPGSIYVFAALKKCLSRSERDRIRALVDGLRPVQRRGEREFRPILILTQIELLTDEQPPECWRRAGEPWAQYAETAQPHYNLEELCTASQRLHLGVGGRPGRPRNAMGG